MPRKYIKFFVSFFILALILLQLDYSVLAHEIPKSSLGLMALAGVLIFMQIFVLGLRWHYIINADRYNIPLKTNIMTNIAGYFANTVFITSVGGMIAKSALAIKQGVSILHAVFATGLDRFMTLAALLFFTALSLPVLLPVIDQKLYMMLAVTVLAIMGAIIGFALILRSGFLNEYILSNRKRSRVLLTLRYYAQNVPLLSKTIALSIVAQALFVSAVFILAYDMNYNATPLQFLALIPVLALISSLPISFGGWGVREGAFIYGLGIIGFSMESAFLLSLQVGVITLIMPLIAGLPYIVNNDFKTLLKHHNIKRSAAADL